MAAVKSQQDVSVLEALIELRAEINARARTGLVAMSFCRSPGHVRTLLEHRAEMTPSALSGMASFGGPECLSLLLSRRCDINLTEDNRHGPLQALTLFARGNSRAVETAKFLLERRADVNARMVLPPKGNSAVFGVELARTIKSCILKLGTLSSAAPPFPLTPQPPRPPPPPP